MLASRGGVESGCRRETTLGEESGSKSAAQTIVAASRIGETLTTFKRIARRTKNPRGQRSAAGTCSTAKCLLLHKCTAPRPDFDSSQHITGVLLRPATTPQIPRSPAGGPRTPLPSAPQPSIYHGCLRARVLEAPSFVSTVATMTATASHRNLVTSAATSETSRQQRTAPTILIT